MSRPHTEFVQAQWLPWETTTLLPHLDGVEHRVLSRDADSGAMTALLRFPAGWHGSDASGAALDEELYTLSGAVSVNTVRLPEDFFACLPAGFPRHHMAAESETVVLAFYQPRETAGEGFDHDRWVPRTDVYLSIWPPAMPEHGLDLSAHHARARILATDAVSGAQTMVVGYPPVSRATTIETQAVDAEYYLLAGTCRISGRGEMTPGAYIWRPAGQPRVPMSADTACVFLIRSQGGPLRFESQGTGSVEIQETPDCVIPETLAQRLVAGPFAQEAGS